MKWLSESDTKEFVVNSLVRVASGKGYILEGEDDKAFLWNSDKLLKHLLTALAAWVDTGEGKGLKVVRDTKEKRGFVVVPVEVKGKTIPCKWRLLDNGYTSGEVVEDTNPFL